ncbi:hypothetical protein LX81_00031 [Palleronia aestuarii]|uniref:Uncharacterized protein n=1 Tax=Palleronia aestuarii TaxID=568105 RepID=A0A2W7NGP4_9RHOB|nr:molybdopterin guanine dinucleotide synthesis [Palleronia aestuarii]PZX19575.1 hypothetical protein LX81_00031 [Palleronia aestuarii]
MNGPDTAGGAPTPSSTIRSPAKGSSRSGTTKRLPFDTFVAVDWSGAPERGPAPKPDAIWAAARGAGRDGPPVYLRSLVAAEAWLETLIAGERAAGRRLFLGFDFPFGLPAGIAQRITGTPGTAALWDWFAHAFDRLGTGETRFHIAARLNALFPGEGPFWFNGLRNDIPGLPRKKPAPFPDVPERRAVETLARGSFACWQMGGTGAVGSQAMTGMACLGRLKRRFGPAISVWPFEGAEAEVVIVEMWPTLLRAPVARRMKADAALPQVRGAPIKDAAQVEVMVEFFAHAERTGRLMEMLGAPPASAREEEGWILGIGAARTLEAVAEELRHPSVQVPTRSPAPRYR